MGYLMKKYKCPTCKSTEHVIRHCKRGKSIRFKCKKCNKYYSIKTVHTKKKDILNDHLDGLSLQKIAAKYGIAKSNAWKICNQELKKLPKNNEFTKMYCSRSSNIHIPDGKYLNVKGYQRKIPLLWGVDYITHDIPVFLLAKNESFSTWGAYSQMIRILNLIPMLVVCDDHGALKVAARVKFPRAKI